jgi:hypothetical protein
MRLPPRRLAEAPGATQLGAGARRLPSAQALTRLD